MDKVDSIFPIAEVIVKKISGELTPEEETFFNVWISSSSRNQDLFNRIMDAQNLEERNRMIRGIDTREAWIRYSKEIKLRKKSHYIRVLQYAAVLLVPVMIVTLLYITRQENQTAQNVRPEQQINPGSKNALLVLGNGKSINLEKSNFLDIKEEDGTRIVNDNQCLSYHEIKEEDNAKIPENTLIVPRGGEYNLVLSDSSEVYLNSMSKLVFPVNFSKNTREVFLEGEACFIVKKDSGRPFIVNVNGMRIEVMGTTFNVNAYRDQENIITTLVEGKVRLITTNDQQNEYILAPDDQAVFDVSAKDVQINKVNAASYMQWINGVYVFDNQSLGEIMTTLSRWYNFNYWFEQQDIEQITFKGGLNKYESIEPILDIIESTGKVKATINGKNILFSKK